ncbi:RelA/SpoT domain-containing protein [Pontibacter sp. KCTC 32443]|uniref:RelA/SpoT domain-containing protein n=1 Tax=Pontibacter TaxID=323449 RepID=UPI00164EA8A9|nr:MULTISPECIES: RelA/SpoT domain-containing protein [Pontibacter]MBC5774447.1 RelA/SpoT domain-containing protein [Pontibacter sp. KCTC 32443]
MAGHLQIATFPVILSKLCESEGSLYEKGLIANELEDIYNDYIRRGEELQDIAMLVANTVMRQKDVHAVRYRVKEPLHLLKKIIRKKKEYPDRHLNTSNYLEFINDLVGVRILHLYKETCHEIGNYIQQIWELKREPYAYVRRNGLLEAKKFSSRNYRVFVNDRGYKAQHYIIKVKPARQQYFVEVQVKTLFEEGWSEVDHRIRYPDHKPNELLHRLLWLLNHFTSTADEVATQIQALADDLHTYMYNAKAEPRVTVSQLHSHIDMLPVEEQEKQYLYACLAKLTGS